MVREGKVGGEGGGWGHVTQVVVVMVIVVWVVMMHGIPTIHLLRWCEGVRDEAPTTAVWVICGLEKK